MLSFGDVLDIVDGATGGFVDSRADRTIPVDCTVNSTNSGNETGSKGLKTAVVGGTSRA